MVCVDRNAERINRALAHRASYRGRIVGVVADANEPLPFEVESFKGAVIVHPMDLLVLETVAPLLCPGGVLVFETYEARGENWRSLPAHRSVRARLKSRFGFLDYKERLVGPNKQHAVVKLCAFRL